MKRVLLTTTLTICSLWCLAQYHIRIECDNAVDGGKQYYTIKYTTNNWIGSDYVQTFYVQSNYYTDDPNDFRTYNDVIMFQFYSPNKDYLILMAKKLKTYSDLLNYNKSLAIEFNKKHKFYVSIKPIITPYKPPITPIKQNCCKSINIY